MEETGRIQKKNIYQIQSLYQEATVPDAWHDRLWQQIELRPGMWMSMLESPSKGKVKLEYQKDPAMIDFGFVLSGRINHRILNDRNSMGASGGFAGIGYFPGRKGIAEISDKNRLRILHLHMVPELLYGMVHEDLEDIPNDFRDIIEGNTGRTFMSKRSMGPITRMTVSEIFNPASSGSPKKLFLEYKAMELLNMQITHLMNHENGSGISASERSRIIEARDMLLQNLADPPSLNNLSRHFSLSRNKLQQGFRVMFGNSVFGYLREHKMQKACHLFKTTDMNVSQVAWETGYINVSKFTRAFKKRFGALPNQYRQSILL